MNVKRVMIAGLAAAGVVTGGAVVTSPASADTQTSYEGFSVRKVLRYGQKGEEIRALQWMLNCEGFPVGRPPGNFGSKTRQQVKALQTKRNIMQGPDGNVGAATWHSLYQHAKPMNHGQRNNDCVRALQVLLNKWNYGGKLPISGNHLNETRKKLMRFQREHGMDATGEVNALTFNKLVDTPAGQ